MLVFRFKILLLAVIFICLLPLKSRSDTEIKTVVVFFALNPNLPAYHQFTTGFKSSLNANKEIRSNVILEYCDIYRFGNSENIETLVSLYNEKYRTAKIDLLITIGPGLHPYLEKYNLEMLKTTPTINVDFTNTIMSSDSLIAQNELNVGLEVHVGKTVQSAIDLFPDYREIFVFSGNSTNDEYFLNLFKQIEPQFSNNYSFKYITGIPFDSTLAEAGKVPAQSLVFVPSYLSDSKIPVYNTPEASSLIASVTKAPVFPVFDSFALSSGSIGGNVLSLFNVGGEIGRLTASVLKGVSLKELEVDKSDFYQHTYNWEQLKSRDLLKSAAIPENSRMYYKKVSFFELYKWQISLLFFFLVSQTLLIIYLIRLNKRQKEIVRQKIENENIYRQLVREDRLMRMVELTASLSHELSQPLTSILYSAQAGLRFLKSGKLDEKQNREIFENIVEDDQRAGNLISSVKNLMKLETRESEKLNLNALIQDTLLIFSGEAKRNNIEIKLSLEKYPVFIFGDKIQLQQVFLNFLFNGSIAMEKNDISNRKLKISQIVRNNTVTVSVADNGPGIEESIKESIFKPFVTNREKGFGIGLAVSRSIIEKHNGKIWAANLKSGGAEFSFNLQIVNDEK
ncbi:MAG: HAMP domain-containing histidine kinase [Bacteroidetes bacterium]|nr:MAG: HAMP domain-containing histidine kinase [Bacteroidota bacterium]